MSNPLHPLAILWEIRNCQGNSARLGKAARKDGNGGFVPDISRQNCDILKNIAYANHDGVELLGDLYLPTGQGPFPLLINVHGGYWRRGARATFAHWGPYLAARGYAGFTISYRLTRPGKKAYPEAVHDVRAAVQFMRGRAEDFRLDPERIALWGNSAGAQLASLVALAGRDPLFGRGYPPGPPLFVSTQ